MYNKVSTAPFTDFTRSTSLRTFLYWAALFPQIAMLAITGSWKSLVIIAAAILGTALSQLNGFFERQNLRMNVAYSLLAGSLVGFFLPPDYPPASVFFITFIFMFVCLYFYIRMRFQQLNISSLFLFIRQ